MPVNTAGLERLFSTLGSTLTKGRSRLAFEKAFKLAKASVSCAAFALSRGQVCC